MKTWIILLTGIFVIAGIAAWLWYARCERICLVTDRKGEDLIKRGEYLSLLALINDVDGRCNCTRFTSGDAPAQYALAEACIRLLLNDGQSAQVNQIMANARSPILKELSKLNVLN